MIKDKAHNFLECLDCHKQLADVVVTREVEVTFNYMALCPFCGGESALINIEGLVATGSVPGTLLGDRKVTGDKVVLHMRKE